MNNSSVILYRNEHLQKYVGTKFFLSRKDIEKEFPPYKILISNSDFLDETVYYKNTIRVIVKNGYIFYIQFG